jgi:hypothetical protein
VLEHGRVVEMGKHAELLARQGAYARLYAANYGLSPQGVAPSGTNGVPVQAPAVHD